MRTTDYREYLSRPFLYIRQHNPDINLHQVAEKFYSLIFIRLAYKSKKLVDSLVSASWTSECLHLFDPVLERQIKLFKYQSLKLRTLEHMELPCVADKCEREASCPITKLNKDTILFKIFNFLDVNKNNV